ncbi:MAG TPA: M28 family peptidase [Baekduia sp.]|nr:M28 family peptidase [Baekduia sp.]
MLDPRLYRVAFVPVLLALLVAAFSLQDRPRPIGTTLTPEAFDGIRAGQTLDELAQRFPSRRPGSAGDEALAAYVAAQFRDTVPGTVAENHFQGKTVDGKRDLVNVVATRPGVPGPGIVVVAHRDAAHGTKDHPARAELSATAALLELARVAADGRLRRTITFISTSGGSGGFAGASEEAKRLTERADAVIVLGAVDAATPRRPFVVAFSNGRGQAPVQLQRTVQRAVRAEVGTEAGAPRALTQWLRMAVPATIGEQGPFLRAGQPAVLLSATGERPPAFDAKVDENRTAQFGRAALRTLYALDNFRDLAQPPRDDLVVRGKVMPGWAVRLLVGTLLLPPLLMGVDALARLRRRHEPMGPWTVWALASGIPFLLACLFARLLAAIGLISAAPGAPIPPQALRFGGGAAVALFAILLVFALGWLVARPALLHASGAARVRKREPDAPGATVAVGLLSVAVAAGIWVGNPYAAMLVVPAVHLWPWALTPDLRWPRWASLAIVVSALLPLALVWWVDGRAFGYDLPHGAWFWTLLVAGGHVPAGSWVLWSLLWGCAVAAGLVAIRRRRPQDDEPDEITVRGPVTYAGPGSLGGTGSALRQP